MDDKIKAALRGDAAAAAECTAAGIAIPCPFCGATKIVDDGLDCYCDKCDAQASNLQLWSRRAPAQSEDNPPLTLDELREMDCEPVWVEEISKLTASRETRSKGYVLARWGYVQVVADSGLLAYQLQFSDYEKAWLAYRRKPEQEGEQNV